MNISEITERVNTLGNAWEHFKQVNDQRLSEIERKGHADPLYDDQLGKISHALDNYKQRIDRMETAFSRPAAGVATKSASPFESEYKHAFCNYLRKGMDAGLEAFEGKALSVGSDPDGGYLVTPTISSRILTIVHESSPLRQIAAVETISSDALEMIDDRDEAGAGWTAETGSVSDTDTPTVGKKGIPVHELYAQPKATQKLIDDSAIDIENWIAEKVADIRVLRDPFTEKPFVKFYTTKRTGGDVVNFEAVKLLKISA